MEDGMRKLLILVFVSAFAAASANGQDTPNAGMQRRIVLAERYLSVTHKDERLRNLLSRGARLSWDTCADDACRSALDKAIESAVNETTPEFERAYTNLMATRLTEDDLNDVIAFAQSPHGQAVRAAEEAMDDDLIKMLQPYAMQTSESIRRSFCATQTEACARVYARFANKAQPRP
jgi:hypothetical protein